MASESNEKTVMWSFVFQTANTIAWFLYHMARNPEKQELLRREVNRLLPRDYIWTSKSLNNVPYLKSCVKETHRFVFRS